MSIHYDDSAARRRIDLLTKAMAPERTHQVIAGVAAMAFAKVVRDTPKRWFGQVRGSWQMRHQKVGQVVIANQNKVMLFLEEGTANAGQGYIYPVRKKMLYIPLNRRASFGWTKSLKRGKDYVLARRVRGIKPRHIVAKARVWTENLLFTTMKAYIRRALSL